MALRIHGLVRAHKTLRTQLQHGIPHQDQPRFKKEVRSLLRKVEELCTLHRTTPQALPAPSRNAYLALKQIDLDNLPQPPHHDLAPPRSVRISGLLQLGHHTCEQIWKELDRLVLSTDAQGDLRIEIAAHATHIETLCQQEQQTPHALEPPSQRVYTWLCFLARRELFSLHLHTLLLARKLAKSLPPTHKPLRIEILPMQALWRLREHPDVLLLRCNPGYLEASEEVWLAILRSAFARASNREKQLVREYAETEEYQDIQLTLEAFLPQTSTSTRGQHHHLCESFERVNQTFFESQFQPPHLRWSQQPTTRIFGHYLSSHDQVMISTSLDDPRVPRYVFDFVMFHELLHKKHGAFYQHGRRIVHSADFLREERTYPHYNEAELFLSEWARQLS
ncbi:MAG: hypothetical protein H6728_09975 [Myxococcales bacterium]|nr:hypothetical protein [Myxococcales bacterium]MCB9643389.1 hypothetical protein [Myxococcales bacterium]